VDWRNQVTFWCCVPVGYTTQWLVSSLWLTKHHAMKAYWAWRYSTTHSLPRQLKEVSGQVHGPAAFLLGYGQDDRSSRVRFPARAGNFSLHHHVRNGSGAHPASYPMDTGGSFPWSKAAAAWSWPLTSIYCRGQECVELYLHSLNTSSWCGAQLKHGNNFTFYLTLPLTIG
jgi:hypothetical protein